MGRPRTPRRAAASGTGGSAFAEAPLGFPPMAHPLSGLPPFFGSPAHPRSSLGEMFRGLLLYGRHLQKDQCKTTFLQKPPASPLLNDPFRAPFFTKFAQSTPRSEVAFPLLNMAESFPVSKETPRNEFECERVAVRTRGSTRHRK